MRKRFLCFALAWIMVLTMIPIAGAAGLDNFTPVYTYADNFADVDADQWYAPNVRTAYELGLIKGISETAFHPDGNVTIAESIALACRLHNIYGGTQQEFEQGSVWYQVYVDYAVENGIIRENAFADWDAPATRLQFAEIFAAALPKEALNAINRIAPGQIPDVAKNEAVYSLYNAGVLTGSDDDGTFFPNSSIKRSEVAAIVTRMADKDLRVRFALADMNDQKEPSAWEEYTEDDDINFHTLTTVFKGAERSVGKAESHLSKIDGDKVNYSSVVLCQDYLAMCYEYFDVLALTCENYDYLEETYDLAILAMDTIDPFLELPLPEPGVNYSYYIEEYMSCVDGVVTITAHLDDEISDLSTMF